MEELRNTVNVKGRSPEQIIQRALAAVRAHLGMEIAYLSEFVEGKTVFRAVDSLAGEAPIQPGDSMNLDDVYCRHICDGRMPRLIPDTSAEPTAAAMPITRNAPIGSHVSVPIRRDDGSIYGMFCCLSTRPSPTLNARDLEVMETFASLSGDQVNTAVRSRVAFDTKLATLRDLLENRRYSIRLQPIFDIGGGQVSGFEALCRFQTDPYRSPDKWFADAAEVGMMTDLELAVLGTALQTLRSLPDDVYVSVNASPETVASGRLEEVFDGHPLERIVLEITEHMAVSDEKALVAETLKWRYRGVKVAIDDAGAGYSGLQQIVRISPDILKLDMSLTSGIDSDPAKRSLAAAMVHFAAEQRSVIVAEGIETAEELAALTALGIERGQGWHLGKPDDLAMAQALCGGPPAVRAAAS